MQDAVICRRTPNIDVFALFSFVQDSLSVKLIPKRENWDDLKFLSN